MAGGAKVEEKEGRREGLTDWTSEIWKIFTIVWVNTENSHDSDWFWREYLTVGLHMTCAHNTALGRHSKDTTCNSSQKLFQRRLKCQPRCEIFSFSVVVTSHKELVIKNQTGNVHGSWHHPASTLRQSGQLMQPSISKPVSERTCRTNKVRSGLVRRVRHATYAFFSVELTP